MVMRSARSAVSPEVIGSTMTPISAMMPPTLPRTYLQTIPMVPVASEDAQADAQPQAAVAVDAAADAGNEQQPAQP